MRRNIKLRLLLSTTILLLILSATSASVIYVKPTGSDVNSGLSWSLAKKTVQAGINAALYADEVWVSSGTYTGCVTMQSSVSLYGGFVGTETNRDMRNWKDNRTILDGNKTGSVITVPEGSSSTIDGFIIRNGKAEQGGGIRLIKAWARIEHNVIENNEADYIAGASPGEDGFFFGGGIYCFWGKGYIINNIIRNNTCGGCGESGCEDRVAGGGIYISQYSSIRVLSNTIIGNKAYLETDTPSSGHHELSLIHI